METRKKSPIRSAVLWAASFFGTLCVLSVGFAAYVGSYPATAVPGTGTLSSSEWNKMVTLLQNLDNRGSTVTVTGTRGGTTLAAFAVSTTYANTLLASNPTTSSVTVPRNGTYDVTVIGALCDTGANGYVSTSINVNGAQKISVPNLANSCGSSTAKLTFALAAGDVVTGNCANGQGMTMSCFMTVTQLQ